MISCCGLECTSCRAFVATAKNDDAMRAEVAKEWSKAYDTCLEADQINCTGCRGKGVKFAFCEAMCEIRKCCVGKHMQTCADCPDFACSKLDFVHRSAPAAKETLASMRKASPK